MQYPISPISDDYAYLQAQCFAIARSGASSDAKLRELYDLVARLFGQLADAEHRPLASLFSKIVYTTSKYPFPAWWRFAAQRFRKEAESRFRNAGNESGLNPENLVQLGLLVLGHGLLQIGGRAEDVPFLGGLPGYRDILRPAIQKGGLRFKTMRAQAIVHYPEKKQLRVVLDDADGTECLLAYNTPEGVDGIKEEKTVEQAVRLLGLPLSIGLIDLEIGPDQQANARMLVMEPDYLIDVTAVAESFEHEDLSGAMHLLRKYIPVTSNPPLALGNIANFFLDSLIHDPDLVFENVFPQVFELSPLSFVGFSDEVLIKLMRDAKKHFSNLQHVVLDVFPKEGIEREKCYIEASFYVPNFGLQGRLDLFHDRGDRSYDIVELKSGKPFMANHHGLNEKHFVQTLLYDLMIKSAKGFDVRMSNYILYSGEAERALRYAPSTEVLQRKAMRVRNRILLAESALWLSMESGGITPMAALRKLNTDQFRGFVQRDIARFQETMRDLLPVEITYLERLSAFIAREQVLAKVGRYDDTHSHGLASLWLEDAESKDEAFQILRDLKLESIEEIPRATVLQLRRSQATNPLANFRVGDIVVLYPSSGESENVLKAQVHKSTITALEGPTVTLQMRAKQLNTDFLKEVPAWNLEHDVLDSGFLKMYKALFRFAEMPDARRHLFLGLAKPTAGKFPFKPSPKLSEEHNTTLQRMLEANDYYLLWGPPGTGKTTLLLKNYVRYILENTNDRILLLAYTNRAVDEICSSIRSIGDSVDSSFIRIGSNSGTAEEHRSRLLTSLIGEIHSRAELRQFLEQQRIVIATASSLMGKEEIFSILKFQHALVDEASQILDPMLCGILPRVRKWILIGDHKQLPAVVVQPSDASVVKDPDLRKYGIENLRNSYFERMYMLCERMGWENARGVLSTQGRMHADIMRFPASQFYNNKLQVLPKGEATRDFTGPLEIPLNMGAGPLDQLLASERMIYLPSKPDPDALLSKTHLNEAILITEVVQAMGRLRGRQVYRQMGIIVPFRAQIAAVRHEADQVGIPFEDLVIDTVERFQGAAYEIVVLALSVQHPAQLQAITSLNDEGVDRKLNVAITRAREQFILIGDEVIIKSNPLYRELMESCIKFEFNYNDSII